MPKITAASVELHIAQQKERILSEALRLFQTHGYLGADIGTVAEAVGLKRNSLYRYFANKDDLLLACVELAMEPVIKRNKAIAEGFRPPQDRVLAWVDAQFDFAAGPDHAFYTLARELRSIAPDVRTNVLKLHIGLYKTLSAAVKACLTGSDRNATIVSSLISGMVQSAASLAIENGGAEDIKQELHTAILVVLQSSTTQQDQSLTVKRRTSS